jgi:hypothetical protein
MKFQIDDGSEQMKNSAPELEVQDGGHNRDGCYSMRILSSTDTFLMHGQSRSSTRIAELGGECKGCGWTSQVEVDASQTRAVSVESAWLLSADPVLSLPTLTSLQTGAQYKYSFGTVFLGMRKMSGVVPLLAYTVLRTRLGVALGRTEALAVCKLDKSDEDIASLDRMARLVLRDSVVGLIGVSICNLYQSPIRSAHASEKQSADCAPPLHRAFNDRAIEVYLLAPKLYVQYGTSAQLGSARAVLASRLASKRTETLQSHPVREALSLLRPDYRASVSQRRASHEPEKPGHGLEERYRRHRRTGVGCPLSMD